MYRLYKCSIAYKTFIKENTRMLWHVCLLYFVKRPNKTQTILTGYVNNGLNNSFNTTNKRFLTMSIGLLFEETLSSRISPFIALFHLVLFVKQFKQRFVRSPYLSFSSSEIDNPYSFRVTFENTSFIFITRMIPKKRLNPVSVGTVYGHQPLPTNKL